MNPEIAKTLAEQRHGELTSHMTEGRRAARPSAGPGWVRRHVPRWHVSWTRTVLSPVSSEASAAGRSGGRLDTRGSSVVIIISAYR